MTPDRGPGRRAPGAILLLLLLLPGLAAVRALRVPQAVDLTSFDVLPADGRVFLDWETGSELEFAGFYVLRNDSDTGDYADWDPIPVEDADSGETVTFIGGRDDFGAIYHFIDRDVQNNITYCYVLEAANNDGTSDYYPEEGAVCVVPGQPTPTPTLSPTVTITHTPTASPTGGGTHTATPVRPSRTPRPTRTGTLDPTLTPTVTRTPTVTLTPTETPLPTFLPTYTPTRTPTATGTRTPTVTVTRGALLAATQRPAAADPLLALADRADLTLAEGIVLLTALIGLLGGVLYLVINLLFLRDGGH